MSPETIARLAEIHNVIGIKECNLDQVLDVRRLTREDFSIYSGNDDQIIYNLVAGGSGVVSVISNIMPEYTVIMTKKYFGGDVSGALKMQLDAMPLIGALFSDVNPIPVKTALQIMGYCNGLLRMPLVPMADDKWKALKSEMIAMDLV